MLPLRRDDAIRWGATLRLLAKLLPGGLPETPRGTLIRIAGEVVDYLIVSNPRTPPAVQRSAQ